MGSLMEARRRILLSSPHSVTIQNTGIASFSTDMRSPLRALTLGIDPVQDLHGYDAPWPGGGGKNKFDVSVIPPLSGEQSSGTVFRDSSGNISVKASASSGGTAVYVGGTPGYMLLKDCAPNLRVGGTYTLSFSTTGTQKIIYLSVSARSWNEGTSTTITQDDLDSRVYFYASGVSTSATISKFQIEEGSTATTYAPYSNLCPISGWDGANVWRTGRNLLDVSGSTVSGNQYYIGANSASEFPFYLKAGTYTLSEKWAEGNAAYSYWRLQGTSDNNIIHISGYSSGTFTLTQDGYYRFWYYGFDMSLDAVSDIQLELSSTPTPYTPYTGTTIPITWEAAGTVYGGVWDVLAGVLRVTHAGVDMGTLDWSAWGTVEGLYGANISDMKAPTTADERKTEIICSMYPVAATATMNNNFTDKSCARYQQSVFLRDTGYATADALTAALDGVQFVYPLATPLEYTLTAAQLDTLAGQNVVWGDCGPVELLKYWTHK